MTKKSKYKKEARVMVNPQKPDTNADKSGTDSDSDKTLPRKNPGKYDKPKKETDPDQTGIDTESDKTKK